MAVGFPAKTTYANGDVFSASDINDTNGTLNLIATQPAFRAFRNASSNFSITAGVATKVPFNGETFDTNSNFDAITNYRFTPTVAGYYQLNATVLTIGANGAATVLMLYFNGARSNLVDWPMPSQGYSTRTINDIYYFNGSTDYAEVYVIVGGGTTAISYGTDVVNFSGAMIRRA